MARDSLFKRALVHAARLVRPDALSDVSVSRVNGRQLLVRELGFRASLLGLGRALPSDGLRRFRDLHRGQRAFIMGNGPSLNACALDRLADEHTFGVNAIYLNRETMGFDPTYYVVEDVFVAEDRAAEIKSYRGPTKFIGWPLWYVLRGARDAVWCNVRYDYRPDPDFPRFSTDCATEMWVGGSVTYLCMQLAFYMGFSEVYLIGFDHSYRVDRKKNQIAGEDMLSQDDDKNHFASNYFGKGFRWHDPRLDRMEAGFRRAREAFERAGRVIRNATRGGHLECFERVDYDSLFPSSTSAQTSP